MGISTFSINLYLVLTNHFLSGSTNCIVQTLTNFEKIVGTLSISNILSYLESPNGKVDSALQQKDFTCTSCTKQAYNTIKTDFPDVVADIDDVVKDQCGASFLGTCSFLFSRPEDELTIWR